MTHGRCDTLMAPRRDECSSAESAITIKTIIPTKAELEVLPIKIKKT